MYEKMYCKLFNAVTDALVQMESLNFGLAERILRDGQRKAENIYVGEEEEEETELPYKELLSPGMNVILHSEPSKRKS
ncbi:MAG: hypothetical protein HFF07_08615 [Oscillospiraceae bacterium]|jgi:hypothetical protein|nr:hypothetical protein [Oscillospiraceae bacterium]